MDLVKKFLKTFKAFKYTIKSAMNIETREYPEEAYPKRIKFLEDKFGKDIKKKFDSQYKKDFEIPERFRGFRRVDPEACIHCGLCEKICPNNCIELVEIDSEENPEYGGEEYPQIYFGRCSFCGFCVDICPTGAMFNTTEHKLSTSKREDMLFSPEDLFMEKEDNEEDDECNL
ncbi:MAG: NADH dehydrogenase subunit I [Candidatus Methanohalarchaeum thermophilum]|uniref:NADH dehydrogenase subunit I n=1 Tax=Methanohalarchaeum thermophilum TaxID=1903181 RepID=A0A1Q6DXA0_METT1|nr:MAG: NADH dehydrogenase subunit I [Candidatus Methanohalarchaeum thermophilum]